MLSRPGHELKRSKYRLLGLVGQGQFGRVYCAVHRQTGQMVALKNLEQERFPTHRFLRELRFLISLQHPNIVTCYSLEHTPTGRYLVMDYCEGGTLRGLMREDSRPSLSQSIALIIDILLGLEHAHSRGIVHCDIKPENILLNLTDQGWTARISDFGIARLSQELKESRRSFGNTGSPAYMAPERFYGQYSPSSDLYSVGILLYEVLAGDRPFSGTPTQLMTAHLNSSLKFSSAIPENWRPILATVLQKLAARRFRSAGEMLVAVRQVAAAEGIDRLNRDHPLLLPALTCNPAVAVDPPRTLLQEPAEVVAIAPLLPSTPGSFAPINPPVYWASRWRLGRSELATAVAADEPSERTQDCQAVGGEPMGALVSLQMRPQGCFAIATQAVYFLPTTASPAMQPYQTVYRRDYEILTTLETQGRWLAILASKPGCKEPRLTFLPALYGPGPLRIAPRSISLSRVMDSIETLGVLALDVRHVAVLQGLVPAGTAPTPHAQSQIEIFTRRGTSVGGFTLPVPLQRMVSTTTPYRFLATDANHPECLLIVDLKPFRINRIGLDFVPQFLVATHWGYVVANRQGRITVLNDLGQQVGQLAIAPEVTAIAPLPLGQLAIATWNGTQSALCWLDLGNGLTDLIF